VKRDDGSSYVVTNCFGNKKEVNELGANYQRTAPKQKSQAKNKNIRIEAPRSDQIINSMSVKEDDIQVVEIMRSYLKDMLGHSFSPLIESI
jgi:Flp pilus assembly secretin CpaC